MYDTNDWRLSRSRKLDAATGGDRAFDYDKSAAGWWIVPSVILGSLGWVGIFSLIL